MTEKTTPTYSYQVTTSVRGEFDHPPTSDDIALMLEVAARSIQAEDPSTTIVPTTVDGL